MIRLEAGQATDTGRRREKNEDSMLVTDRLFAVADGLGGHQGGEVASALAVATLAAEVDAAVAARSESRRRRGRARRDSDPPSPTVGELLEAMGRANQAILNRASTDATLTGMATTLCVLAVVEDGPQEGLAVLNIGDSRVYRSDDRGFRQLTHDHTVGQEMLRFGATQQEADAHPESHQLSRVLGVEPTIAVEDWALTPVCGDRYLLCSDGLTNMVTDRDIHAVLRLNQSPTSAAEALVQVALAHGGKDNVTVVIVDVADVGRP